jgi:hypothetical protein
MDYRLLLTRSLGWISEPSSTPRPYGRCAFGVGIAAGERLEIGRVLSVDDAEAGWVGIGRLADMASDRRRGAAGARTADNPSRRAEAERGELVEELGADIVVAAPVASRRRALHTRACLVSRLREQNFRQHVERLDKIVDAQQRQVDMTIFYLAQIGLRDPRNFAEFFLRPSALFAETCDICTEELPNIHHRSVAKRTA